MAASSPNRAPDLRARRVRARATWAAASVAAAGTACIHAWAAGTEALVPNERLPISLNADYSDFDRKANRLVFEGVEIRQGELGIAADRADSSALDFNDSTWVFRGRVRISSATASIEADDAELSFVDHRLDNALITGNPAVFEHTRTQDGETLRGRARRLEYDLDKGILRLSENAWLSEGANEISGATLVYHIADQRIVADSDDAGRERVEITISPMTLEAVTKDKAEPAGGG